MNLNVNYQAQEPIEKDEQKNWCGLACLSMVLNFYLQDNAPSLEELYDKYGAALEKTATFKEIGLQHKDLLKIARAYGLKGYRRSWWSEPGAFPLLETFLAEGESEEEIEKWLQSNKDEGVFALKKALSENIPVIVSMSPDFAQTKNSHLVVVKGYEDNQILIHDSYKDRADVKISEEEFKTLWLRRAIIIYQ